MIPMDVDKELQQFICNKCKRVFYIPKKYTKEDADFFLKNLFGCPYCNYNSHPKVGIFLREVKIETTTIVDENAYLKGKREGKY